MFRNQYDTDVTTFSPDGRLHQVEYAEEAVNQGSTTVGLRSNTAVVIAASKRAPSELGSYQEKIVKIDDHMGISCSGLIADARVLARYLQNETLNHKWAYESKMQIGRLVTQLSDKSQVFTQKAQKRPYGVGLLVAGCDKTGPHLYETKPSGDFYEYVAQAIGDRPQAAKSYFEKRYQTFGTATKDELIRHALAGLKAAAQEPLTTKNVSVAFVCNDVSFTMLDEEALAPFIAELADEEEKAEEKVEEKVEEEMDTQTS